MLPLALTLQLFGTQPALPPQLCLVAPQLRLVAPLLVSSAEAPPDLAVPPISSAAPEAHVRVGAVAAASAGILVADVASAYVMLLGLSCVVDNMFNGGGSCAGRTGVLLMLGGSAAFVFASPAAGLYGARLAGEMGDAGTKAYWMGFLVRLAGLAAASALGGANAGAGGAGFLAVELVLTPYVIARVLADAPHPVSGPAPLAAAVRPERDPALPFGRIR